MEATYQFSKDTDSATFAEFTCMSRFNEGQLTNNSVSQWCNVCMNPIDKYCLPNSNIRIPSQFYSKAFPFSSETWSKRKLVDLAFGQVLVTDYVSIDPMLAYIIEMRKQKSKIDPFYLWEILSGEEFLNEDFNLLSTMTYPNRTNNMDDLVKDFINQNDLGNLLENPKVHGKGDFGNEQILIPLCSFESKKLQKCNLFRKVGQFYHEDRVCYTFEKKSNERIERNSLQPYTGLNFVINFRLPRDSELEPVRVIIYPQGTVPDGYSYPNSVHDIGPSIVSHIGINAIMLTNVIRNFESMSDDLKKCFLEEGYHQVNCRMTEKIELARKQCGCMPWFISGQNETICMKESLSCFHETMENPIKHQLTKESCPKECIYTRYSIVSTTDTLINTKSELSKIARSFGDDWKNYILDETSALFYADYEITYKYDNEVQLMTRTSLVHVNFIEPEATLITKDAKVTFSDQLGTIGGTFGVFLGLSFVGILDFLILCMHWMNELIKSNNF